MALFTKSVQIPHEDSDGVRICIMRRPGKDVEWDIWMPHLAPSHELLTEYHAGDVDWGGFVERYEREVVKGERQYFEMLVELAKKHDITLLCWEEEPAQCHRRLVAEACHLIDSQLSITIR